ncbi:MAG: hypothetical protein J6U59_00140 [Alistipes sp.]|nr:hypothetical protein [Alistipes sp.]
MRRLLAFAVLVLGLASCQQDFDAPVQVGGEVDFQLAVAAPEIAGTRAGDKDGDQKALNSAYGAIDYLQGGSANDGLRTDWSDVNLRYSLEVYDVDDKGNVTSVDEEGNPVSVKDRLVYVVDEYQPVTFNLRLVPNRNYRFVVFADFVDKAVEPTTEQEVAVINDEKELGLHHSIGTTLGNITVKNDDINDECTDAYFATKVISIVNSAAQDMELKRPYGKVRVVATDLAELNLNDEPRRVEVTYDAKHPVAFNAITGEIEAQTSTETITFDSPYNEIYKNVEDGGLQNHFYTEGYDNYKSYGTETVNGVKRHTHMTLFTDYILAEKEGQTPYHFTMTVESANGKEIKTTQFNTDIPVERNKLTTVIGNVLTTATQINITVDDNFDNKDNQYYVFEAFVNGGKVTLDQNYTIGRTLYVDADAVLDLNGYSITNTANNSHTDVIVVREGASLTIVDSSAEGKGTIEAVSGNDGYAVISKGTLIINGGNFKSGVDAENQPNAVVYARDNGKIYVNGGVFHNDNLSKYVLNKRDQNRDTTTIEVSGGRFENFDPANNAAEGPETTFMADGFTTVQDGDWYEVVAAIDYEDKGDHAEVYTAKGLLWWASRAEENLNYGLKIMGNINMPALEVACEDGEFYYTDTPITVTDGIPSGSNWPAFSDYETSLNAETGVYEYYGGTIEGNGKTISGLLLNQDLVASGFLCWTKGAKVDNLTFNNTVVYNKGGQYGETYTGTIIGRCWDGSHVNNCHITNSSVLGKNEVGGIVGRVYRRTIKTNTPDGQPQNLMEKMAYVTYCTTDENTTVKGASSIGGIVGMNYGCIVGQCINNAQVSATVDYAGGIVGYHRSYTTKTDGYIIACRSTDKATIKSKYAGGIAGYVLHDKNHLYAKSWIVGCVSESTISGTTNSGGIIGNANNATITSCWAVKKGGASTLVGKGSATNNASYIYNNATDATQADIDAMNAAIVAFNKSDHNVSLDGTVGAVMLKRWALVNGVPVLQ